MNIRTENGIVTLKADGAIAKGEIVYVTSDGVKKSESATQAKVFGVALDGAADEALVPVAVFGAYTGTCPVKVTAAIAAGEFVDAAGGKGAKADLIVGMAVTPSTASGDFIEVALCVPNYALDNDTNT